jgi:uncharacterized membrane protein YhaH (DUF805 family)
MGLLVILGVIATSIVRSVASAAALLGGNRETAQTALHEALDQPLVVLLLIITAVLLIVLANIAAKRLRNLGLPGWIALLCAAVVALVVLRIWAPSAAYSFFMVLWLVLLFMPADTLRRVR